MKKKFALALLVSFFEVIFTALGIIGSLFAILRVKLMGDWYYLEWLKRDLADCESILELGCGSNSPILKIGYGYKTDSVDIWNAYVENHNRAGDYRSCKQTDILQMDFPEKAYDAVVICDVMEHLDKPMVYKAGLFANMEKAAKKRIIIFAPNGFIENDEVDGDPYQAHVSAWFPRDYYEQGYAVAGATGLRHVLGKASLPKYRPRRMFAIIAMLSQPVIYNHPNIAWHSYAVKELA